MGRNKTWVRLAVVLSVALGMVAGCGQQQPPAPAMPAIDFAAEEKAIRAAASEWTVALKAKDLDKTLSFYAADACILPAGMPRATTPEARRKVWETMFKAPAVLASLETTDVTLAHHGDLAYEAGKIVETVKEKKGKATTVTGKYLVVWKKQADGKWKAVADIWNLDS